jgi:hypothetical protein
MSRRHPRSSGPTGVSIWTGRCGSATLSRMVSVVFGMLVCVGLALAVMALVAIPARRAGRDVLSERGEQVIVSLRERQRGASGAGGAGETMTARDDVVGARG